ncbi:MAG: PEP-CTERM sorting domain-containing protein [Gammaproteobacteria bacterium]
MTLNKPLLGACLALATSTAMADFLNPVRTFGSNNPEADPLFIAPGESTDGGLTFALPDYLSLITLRSTAFELPDEDEPTELEEVGVFHDAIFRDSRDNMLVFGSRIEMDLDEEGEINDIFRSGFTGWGTLVGWLPVTANDLRLISTGRTRNSGLTTDDPDLPDLDVVDLHSDLNVEEGNPVSGWFLIKTNAPGFELDDDAVGLFQGGEEGQPPFLGTLAGFVPSATPVPVPAALPLLGSALGLAGMIARRRSRR